MRHAWILISIFLLQGCSNQPEPAYFSKSFQGRGPHKIFITNHGWHTGLVVPASQLRGNLAGLDERFSQVPYVEIGWGDRGFYQAKEITAGLAMQAMTIPTDTVLHVVGVPVAPQIYFAGSETRALCLDNAELASLLKFLKSSFQIANNKIVALEKGIYGDSQFYRGSGRYHLGNTCNKWTAKGLKSIGMDITPILYLSAESIMDYLKDHPKTLKDTGMSCYTAQNS